MPLSWNEIKNKALAFSKRWEDATREDSDAKPFWIDFFEIFGISDKRVASFEHAVKKLPGAKARTDGFVDLFWPGMLLVEHKLAPGCMGWSALHKRPERAAHSREAIEIIAVCA